MSKRSRNFNLQNQQPDLKKQRPEENILIRLITTPNLNDLFFSNFKFEEIWPWRQVSKFLKDEIPQQITHVTMKGIQMLSHTFPKARRVILQDIDTRPNVRWSKSQWPELQSICMHNCYLKSLQVDPDILLTKLETAENVSVQHLSLQWSHLKHVKVESRWVLEQLMHQYALPNVERLNVGAVDIAHYVEWFVDKLPNLQHFQFQPNEGDSLDVPNLPITHLEFLPSVKESSFESLSIAQPKVLESLRIDVPVEEWNVPTQDFPYLQELSLIVAGEWFQQWSMPHLKTLRLKSYTQVALDLNALPLLADVEVEGVALSGTNCPALQSLSIGKNCALRLQHVSSLKHFQMQERVKDSDLKDISYRRLQTLSLHASLDTQYLFSQAETIALLSQAINLETLELTVHTQGAVDVRRALFEMLPKAFQRVDDFPLVIQHDTAVYAYRTARGFFSKLFMLQAEDIPGSLGRIRHELFFL